MEIPDLYNNIYKKYKLINSILSLNLDKWWRKKLVLELKKLNPSPKTICDIGTGTGDLIEILAKNFSNSKIKGIDANIKMLEIALENIKLKNVEFIKSDLTNMPFNGCSFDCITISFATRNVYFSKNFEKIIREINRVLKKDGIFIGVEIINHNNKFLNFFSKLYINTVIFLINLIDPSSKLAYNFLKNSIFNFDLESFKKIMIKNFGNITIKRIFPGNIIIHISKKLFDN